MSDVFSPTPVALTALTIKDFKSVNYGRIDFPERDPEGGASVLAIYGQNGTGKTAVVDALTAFRNLVSGKALPPMFASYTRADSVGSSASSKGATFEYEFETYRSTEKRHYSLLYRISFERCVNDGKQPVPFIVDEGPSVSLRITEETLSCGYRSDDGSKRKLTPVIRITEGGQVEPANARRQLECWKTEPYYNGSSAQGLSENELASLLEFWKPMHDEAVKKSEEANDPKTCHESGRSFIFQAALSEGLLNYSPDDNFRNALIMATMAGNIGIAGTREAGVLESNILPLFPVRAYLPDVQASSSGLYPIAIPMQTCEKDPREELEMPRRDYEIAHATLPALNEVIGMVVPGLEISINESTPDPYNPEPRVTIESIRHFDDGSSHRFPLTCESNGIKRLIMDSMLLVNAYINPQFIAVIDELDAGIFEFLLGELVSIIAESGKGQLIFTSHNMRPLELLNKRSIVVSTTNPDNRYLTLKNLKTTNSLKKTYIRSLSIGGQKESLYNGADRCDIEAAFEKAGETVRTIWENHDEH